MSVFEARLAIEEYLKNCINDQMREEAKNDFATAIVDTKTVGFTWGGNGHEIPVDLIKLNKEELNELLKFITR